MEMGGKESVEVYMIKEFLRCLSLYYRLLYIKTGLYCCFFATLSSTFIFSIRISQCVGSGSGIMPAQPSGYRM